MVVYTNMKDGGDKVRVEFRPPKGLVANNGVSSGVRMYWEVWLASVKAMLSLIAEAPTHVLSRFMSWLWSSGVGSFIRASVCYG